MAPHLARPYTIWVDARNVGAGVFLQEDDSGEERPLCFVSLKWLSWGFNYSVVD